MKGEFDTVHYEIPPPSFYGLIHEASSVSYELPSSMVDSAVSIICARRRWTKTSGNNGPISVGGNH
jgi:hypothetical protein